MLEQMNNNKVFLQGQVDTVPVFSHEVLNEKFYDFNLKVKRLSGSFDILPVTVNEKHLQEFDFNIGNDFACNGQFRSYNKQEPENSKSKLMLTMFAKEILPYNENENPNVIELNGFICKDPIYRVTPFKREICDVLIAVNRSYNKSDYLPCIAWGKNASFVKDCKVGDNVVLVGRIQSRIYQKRLSDSQVVEKVAYEVSLSRVSKQKVESFAPIKFSTVY